MNQMTPRICHVHVLIMRLKFIVTPFRIEFGLVQNRLYQNFIPFRVAKKQCDGEGKDLNGHIY